MDILMPLRYASMHAHDRTAGRRSPAPGEGTRGPDRPNAHCRDRGRTPRNAGPAGPGASTGRRIAAVSEDGLPKTLARQARRQARPPVVLPTFKGKGLRPGVDLDDTADLLDIMDGGRDTSFYNTS